MKTILFVLYFFSIYAEGHPKMAATHRTEPLAVPIHMGQAIAIAKSKSHGKFFEAAFENEDDLDDYKVFFSEPDRSVSEVTVDAKSGKVIKYKKINSRF